MTVDRETVLKALSKVVDHARGADVVSLDYIQGLAIRGAHVGFAVEVPAERAATAADVRAACERAVAVLPGVLSVTAVLTAHSDAPQTPAPSAHGHPLRARKAGLSAAARADAAPPAGGARPNAIPGIAAIVAVASGKGGVGKSTVAANLALALVAQGQRVGLLDADIYGPSVPRLLGIAEKPESRDGKKLEPLVRYGLKTMSIGYLVDVDTPMIWRGPMVMSALTQMLADVNWGELDVLVVDMPPGTGDAQLTMVQRVPLAGGVIVSTPQDLALIDARKGLAMFRKTHVPVLGIVENMSTFVCPSCGTESHIFGHGGARATAAELGEDFLGEIPLHMAIRETSDAGAPIVVSAPQSREARAFQQLAEKVAAKLAEGVRPAPRIVIE